MFTAKQAEILAQQAISLYLKNVGADSAAEAQKALNKLVAVATESVEVVVDQGAALDMLDGVRAAAQTRHHVTNFGVSRTATAVFSIAPETIQ
ncbi:hypothetical protein MKR81_26495 (plasmid) [Vibrio campbellii]|uniref:hypothetical protein n=1 Tax=Vibrio campbellii TaxID=680 RepID=UPI001F07D4FA|nr:hypothetical protein [Vibrio campbellii]UMM06813.1 hypothetical protein MKR81_26495 [Vibrio campbellii]